MLIYPSGARRLRARTSERGERIYVVLITRHMHRYQKGGVYENSLRLSTAHCKTYAHLGRCLIIIYIIKQHICPVISNGSDMYAGIYTGIHIILSEYFCLCKPINSTLL